MNNKQTAAYADTIMMIKEAAAALFIMIGFVFLFSVGSCAKEDVIVADAGCKDSVSVFRTNQYNKAECDSRQSVTVTDHDEHVIVKCTCRPESVNVPTAQQ